MNVMAPWVNRISGGGFRVGNRFFALTPNFTSELFPIHGNAFQSEWMARRSPSKLACTLTSEGPGPYRYEASCTYSLTPGALSVELSAVNRSGEALPFGIGLHPWFPRTWNTILWTPASKVWLEDARRLPTILVDVSEKPEYDFRAPARLPEGWINNGYTHWAGLARIDWPDRDIQLQITASASFDCVQIYSPGREADFFCFEPTNHIADAFNTLGYGVPGSVHLIAPGEEVRGSVRFALSARSAEQLAVDSAERPSG